ncbi:CBS domain-containing protein [Pseudomonas aeruginosa]
MRLADVSQLPVLDDGKLVGVIDESDIQLGVHADAPRFRDAVSRVSSGPTLITRPSSKRRAMMSRRSP